MTHTPTPRKITEQANGLSSVDIGDSGIIIVCKSDNARLIVTAVNSHAQLVEALAYVDTAAEGISCSEPDELCQITLTWQGLCDIRAALALAEPDGDPNGTQRR